jgi:hypothetical protein
MGKVSDLLCAFTPIGDTQSRCIEGVAKVVSSAEVTWRLKSTTKTKRWKN